ncbi:MAG: type II secretion system F family protein [bacterium]
MKIDRLDSFYQELSDLLSAGITLPRAVEKLNKTLNSPFDQLEAVHHLLEEGRLKEGFKRLGLPERDCSVLTAGQNSGQLESICRNLGTLYQMWNEMVRKTALACGYFFLVGLGLCGAFSVIILLIVGWRLALGVGFFGLLVWSYGAWTLYFSFKNLVTGEDIPRLGKILFSFPLLKSLHRNLQYHLIYKQWYMLYRAGVSLDQIFQSLARSFEVYEGELKLIASNLSRGSSLAEIEFMSEIFPDSDYRQIATGEESGKLEENLERLADQHRSEVEKIVERMPGYLLIGFYLIFGPLVFLTVLYFFYNYVSMLSEISAAG